MGDAVTIVLAVVAAGGLAAVVWLAVSRGRMAAAAAVGERASEERDRLAGEVEAARGQVAKLQVEAAALRERAEGMGREHEAEVAGMSRAHVAEIETMKRLCDQAIAKEKELAAAQVRGAAQSEERTRKYVEDLEKRFKEAFGSLAGKSLEEAQKSFLELAREAFKGHLKDGDAAIAARKVEVEKLVGPIAETLKKTDETLAAMERERAAAYVGLKQQVEQGAAVQAELRAETGKLVRALREPHVRGRYGEIQLKRVAELAGMTAYCDFTEQDQTSDADGNPLRPDMVVNLPTGRQLVIDAKTNIQAYIEAIEAATPDAAEACLVRFARHVAEQAGALGKKNYWQGFEGSPEFVVMFVPGDQFIDAALSRRPDLFEKAAAAGVIMASPSTLIGLLRAVAVGWRGKVIEERAQELFELGRTLHERAAVVSDHLAKMGAALEQTVKRYNDVVGSYESRLEPTLKRFEEAGAKSGKELAEVEPVTVRARTGALPAAGGAGA